MGENAMNTIISLLPERVIYDAACRYVEELSHEGKLEEAEYLYAKLRQFNACFESLAEAARCLVGRYIRIHKINQAISLYENFPGCENCHDALTVKLKTCHFLVFALIPDHFQKAYSFWKEYLRCKLNACQKWQWVETGVALLECCNKNSLSEEAVEIYKGIKKYENCEICKILMRRAEQVMAKIVK